MFHVFMNVVVMMIDLSSNNAICYYLLDCVINLFYL